MGDNTGHFKEPHSQPLLSEPLLARVWASRMKSKLYGPLANLVKVSTSTRENDVATTNVEVNAS